MSIALNNTNPGAVTLNSPVSGSTSLTFPSTAGTAGQALTTDGSGNLAFATVGGSGTVTSVALSGGTTGLTTSGSPITTSGTISLAGTLAISNGGTSLATLTANNVIIGNGTAAPLFVAPSTSGNVLTSDGTTWTSAASASVTIASAAEAIAGTNNTNVLTPLRLRDGLNASGSAPVFAARAWVSFNGSGTVAIRGSGNVSSITDNGTGDYTVNFTTAMSDSNYAVAMSTQDNTSNGACQDLPNGGVYSTGSCRVRAFYRTGGLLDTSIFNVSFFR